MEPTEIRELVTTTLTALGFGDAKPLGYHVLHRSRHDAGVRFAFEGVSAIWLVEADLQAKRSSKKRRRQRSGKIVVTIKMSSVQNLNAR